MEEPAIDTVCEKDWLEWNFLNWARYMRGDCLPDGMPGEASGKLSNYLTVTGDSERAYDKMDMELAEATNAAIEGLAPAEQGAIRRRYLEAVYRFPRDNYAQMLIQAKEKVRQSLVRRGIWLGVNNVCT